MQSLRSFPALVRKLNVRGSRSYVEILTALKMGRKTNWRANRSGSRRASPAIFIPPLVCAAIILLIWQIAFGRAGATLPSPLVVWKEAYRPHRRSVLRRTAGHRARLAGADSLQRVAIGYGLAAVVGISSAPSSASRSGPCAGSTRSSRCCARCRRWPGCRSRSPPSVRRSPRRSS